MNKATIMSMIRMKMAHDAYISFSEASSPAYEQSQLYRWPCFCRTGSREFVPSGSVSSAARPTGRWTLALSQMETGTEERIRARSPNSLVESSLSMAAIGATGGRGGGQDIGQGRGAEEGEEVCWRQVRTVTMNGRVIPVADTWMTAEAPDCALQIKSAQSVEGEVDDAEDDKASCLKCQDALLLNK